MVKFYSTSSLFKYTWDQVAAAFWQRYPNPYSGHVLSEDVVLREVRQNKLYTTRLLTKTNPLPKWGERFMSGPRCVLVIEESVVDPLEKTITTYTRNVGMKRVMNVEEKCVYSTNQENAKHTTCERSAWVSSDVFGFSYAIQKFGVERYKKNAVKTCKGYEMVLERLFGSETGSPTLDIALTSKEKLKEKARKAAEVAKAKTRPILPQTGSLS